MFAPGTENLPAGATRARVPVKFGVVQPSRRYLGILGRFGIMAQYGTLCGANQGANEVQRGNPASPGGQERPGAGLDPGW